jgi:hypothetical protein
MDIAWFPVAIVRFTPSSFASDQSCQMLSSIGAAARSDFAATNSANRAVSLGSF